MIKLNDKYKIGFDPLNIILYKIGVKGENSKNPGEESRQTIGYYDNFGSLLNKLVKEELLENNNDYNSIKEIIDKIEEFKKDILEKIEEIEGDKYENKGN